MKASTSNNKSGQNYLARLIKKFDPSELKSDYDYWPELASESWAQSKVEALLNPVDFVEIAGMGGSGIVGALVCDLARETNSTIRFNNFNDYHIDPNLDGRTLVLGVSCSGNTEETLSALHEAHSKSIQIAGFSSGGLLERYSAKWGTTFTKTSSLKVPRSSLPGIFFAVLKFLSENKLLEISESDFLETVEAMKSIRKITSRENRNASLSIAKALVDSSETPSIYSQSRTHAVGLRFRQSLNENAKMRAFNGDLPEICHNEIVSWDSVMTGAKSRHKNSPVAITLELSDDREEIRSRYAILKSIIRTRGGRTLAAPSLGDSYLTRIISMLYFLEYSTYYSAILRGIDPMKTPSLDKVKRDLASKLNYVSRLE